MRLGIDVQYDVNSFCRSVGEWLTNDATAATMRKLRSGAGGTLDNFLWSPSPTAGLIDGTPDTFLGRPIYASSNVAAMGSDAKRSRTVTSAGSLLARLSASGPFSADQKSAEAVALYRNAAGVLIGGARTYLNFVPAGGAAAFKIDDFETVPGIARTHVIVQL